MSSLKLIFVAALSVFSFQFAHPFHTPKVALLLLLAIVLGAHFRWVTSWRHGFFWILVTWPIWQPIMPLDPLTSIHDRGIWSLFVLFAWLVHPTREQKKDLASGLAWAAILASCYSMCQSLGWDWIVWESPGLPTSTFGNANFTAHFLLLAWMLARFENPKHMLILKIALTIGILLSGSRAVIGLWLLCILFQIGRQRKHQLWLGLMVIVMTLVGLFQFKNEVTTFARYLNDPASYVTEYRAQPELIAEREPWFRGKRLSLMTRVALYGNSVALAKENLWFGIGAGQFRGHYPNVSQKVLVDLQMSDVYRAASPHNSGLESIILFGLPWTLVCLGWLILAIWGLKDRRFRAALIMQMALSMVSLNYQNPVIVVVLILFWPRQLTDKSTHTGKWIQVLWLLPLLAVVGLDFWQARQNQWTEWQQVSPAFPAHRAKLALESQAFGQAWQDQVTALRRDPYGPETMFNTGVVAWKLAEAGADQGYELGIRAFLLNRMMHPEYRPARDRLIEIRNSGRWQASWDSFIENPSHDAWLDAVNAWRPELEKNRVN